MSKTYKKEKSTNVRSTKLAAQYVSFKMKKSMRRSSKQFCKQYLKYSDNDE